jgi:hypothetical protein
LHGRGEGRRSMGEGTIRPSGMGTSILPKFVSAALIILLILLILPLSSCARQKDKQALADFWDTRGSYVDALGVEAVLRDEYKKGLPELKTILQKLSGSTTETAMAKKLLQEGLDRLAAQQKVLDEIKKAIQLQSIIVTRLHGNAIRITEATPKSLALEIAGKLRELNNLKTEKIHLDHSNLASLSRILEYMLLAAENKTSTERAIEAQEKEIENIAKNSSRIGEIENTMVPLVRQTLDLANQLKNL